MLLIILVCFTIFLEHAIVNGDPVAVVISNSEAKDSDRPGYFPSGNQAYLPPQLYEFTIAKNKKSVRKRSAGKKVDLPADIVKQMENVPFSTLLPQYGNNIKEIVDTHNEYRSQADPPGSNILKMVWNDEAAKKAQEWANKCVQGHSSPEFRRISNCRCSENLFLAPYKVPWRTVIETWHSENVDFKFGVGSINNAETGHYTALMWAQSFMIGCGSAECPNLINKYNFVCYSCPAGNKSPTHTPYIQGKPCASCTKACEGVLCTNPCNNEDNFSDCKTYLVGGSCGNDQGLIKDCPATCKCTNGEIKQYN